MTTYALLIIDMQKAYFRNESLAARQSELVEKANQLVDAAAQATMPVYNVTTAHKRDRSTWTLNMLEDDEGYLFEGDEDSQVVDGLHVESVIPIFKTRDSAFFGTNLAGQLREQCAEVLIILGVSTHGCVAQTAADAYAENFKVILARDAIASHDMSFHEPTFRLLQQEYRQNVLSNSQILELL